MGLVSILGSLPIPTHKMLLKLRTPVPRGSARTTPGSWPSSPALPCSSRLCYSAVSELVQIVPASLPTALWCTRLINGCFSTKMKTAIVITCGHFGAMPFNKWKTMEFIKSDLDIIMLGHLFRDTLVLLVLTLIPFHVKSSPSVGSWPNNLWFCQNKSFYQDIFFFSHGDWGLGCSPGKAS